MIKHLEKEEQFDEEIKGELVLVDFYATWCGPCSMLAPIIEEVEQETNIKVIKVDVDELPNLARRYRVMSIPTLLLFKNGELKDVVRGYMPKKDLQNFLNK